MKLLIVHLSDIHMTTGTNPVVVRAAKIRDAVHGLGVSVDGCVIVVSGDIAFSGQPEEYEQAFIFLTEVRDLVAKRMAVAFAPIVLVPGNHDCYIPKDQVNDAFRNSALETVARDLSQIDDERFLDVCVRPQKAFFNFLGLFDDPQLSSADYLSFSYSIGVGDKHVRLVGYNTAWMVRRDSDQQGRLLFPPSRLSPKRPSTENESDLAIAVFHHPYNWLNESNAREFRNHVQATAHIALTGHEHGSDRTRTHTGKGETIQYLEGGVLQDTYDARTSSFNAVLVDLVERKQWAVHFAWNHDIYDRDANSDNEWRDFQLENLNQKRAFEISPVYRQYLEDTGANFQHRERGKLKFTDTFINLNLREVSLYGEGGALTGRTIQARDLCREVVDNGHVLVTGDDKSGKTSLRKLLFAELRARGLIPLALSGATLRAKTMSQVRQSVAEAFEAQYEGRNLERFLQLAPEAKVLLLDDFHLVKLNTKGQKALLDEVTSQFGHVVMFVNAHLPLLADVDFTGKGLFSEFRQYHIEELNRELREDAIQRWVTLENDGTVKDASTLERIDAARGVLNTILGDRFVPARPVFVLTILQLFHSNVPIDTSIASSGMGYFYEQLIRQALFKALKKLDLSGEEAYLSFVAYAFYEGLHWRIDDEEMLRIHDRYCEAYAVPRTELPFESTMETYVQADMLERVDGRVGFKYRHNYLYFVALYLRDRISELDTQRELVAIAEGVAVQENADILLFLTHLTKDRQVVDSILNCARSIFPNDVATDLKSGFGFFAGVERALNTLPRIYAARVDPIEERRERARLEDETRSLSSNLEGIQQVADDSDEDRADRDDAVVVNVMQILGQLLKNYPRALTGSVKYDLMEAVYSLGLRHLKRIFGDIEGIMQLLLEEYVAEKQAQLSDPSGKSKLEIDKVRHDFERLAFVLACALTLGVIDAVVQSVYSRDLRETYRLIRSAHNSVGVDLIDAGIRLNGFVADWDPLYRMFDGLDGNPLARTVLRHMVHENLKLYPPAQRQWQAVCSRFGFTAIEQVRIRQASAPKYS